ncbi:tape measure protein [Proteus genomosp. 4]|uniref:tape measure protein n=1 Tax=Proteus genomosp. 4 TaxID=1311818 RepID=UPI000D68876A|nr:tape measure protein [Proteus genomosp. 4]
MADVGEIVYQVQMDVGQLLTSQRQLEQRLNRMDDSFNRTSRAANNTEQSMLSLSKVAGVVASALSAGAIINAVDEWGQMAARIKMALNSVEGDVERYAEIQQRFLEVSNRNGKAIETTQELYAGSATSMKELGYNTTQTVDYIESLSSAFTANATGAQQTESAMNALNRAMVIGTLKGNDWHSVLNATPSVVADIAKELSRLRGGVKVTENDVKKMAMQGGISMKLFADAMIKAREENNALADSMDNTIADGFTKLTNSAKAYYGEMNQTLGITRSVSAGFAVLSDNFDEVAQAIAGLATLGAARYFGNLATSMKNSAVQTLNQSKALKESARAQQDAAIQAQRKAQADLRNAQLDRARLQNNINQNEQSKKSILLSNELAAAQQRERAAKLALVQANNAVAASQERANLASMAWTKSIGLLRSALGLIGGPAGFIMIAATALIYFSQKTEQARQAARDFADGIDQLRDKLKELSYQEIARDAQDAKDKQELLTLEMKEQEKQLSALRAQLELQKTALKDQPELIDKNTTRILREITKLEGDLATSRKRFGLITIYLTDAQKEYNEKTKEAIDLSVKNAMTLGIEQSAFGRITQQIKEATAAKESFNSTQLTVELSEKGLDLKKSLEREAKLANAKSEIEKRKIQVEFYAEDNGITDDKEINKLKQYAVTAQEAKDAESERNSKTKESTKSTDAAYEALKRQREEIELLNKGYKDGSLEMAKYDAVKALGDTASPKQIEKAEQLAEEKYNIERNLADKKAALELDLVAKAKESHDKQLADLERITKDDVSLTEQAARRKAEIEAEYQQKIAEIKAKKVVSPQDDLKGKADPIQALANEHAQKLALIKEYENQKVLTEQQSLELMNAANTQYEQARTDAMYELWRNQSLGNEAAAAALDAFSGSASNALTGIITGSMEASDALRSIGNTVLNSLINTFVQAGIEQAKAAWFGAAAQQGAIAATTAVQTAAIGTQTAVSTAAAATTTAAWTPAAIMASIASMGTAAKIGLAAIAVLGVGAIAGARKNGGPVDAGSMYRVGEGGKPEIFKANNGRQYMIPGDNGKVISNKDMQGGGMNVNVVFNDYSSGGHKFDAQTSQDGNTLTIQAFIMDMDNKGPMLQSITRNTSATARARG